jgi:hypothetical protein
MLCSKKISLPSKFNVKLQNFRGGGGVRDLGQGGGGVVPTPCGHVCSQHDVWYKDWKDFQSCFDS